MIRRDGSTALLDGREVTITEMLDCIKRDAPDAFKAWVSEHMVDTLDAHYDVGYNAGYSHGFGEGSRA